MVSIMAETLSIMASIMALKVSITVSIMVTHYRAGGWAEKTMLFKPCLSFKAQSVGRRTASMGIPNEDRGDAHTT